VQVTLRTRLPLCRRRGNVAASGFHASTGVQSVATVRSLASFHPTIRRVPTAVPGDDTLFRLHPHLGL
jgi:hypothetical protein